MTKTFEIEVSCQERLSVHLCEDYEHFAYGVFDTEYEQFVTEKYCELAEYKAKEVRDLQDQVSKLTFAVNVRDDVIALKNKEIEWYRANAPVKYFVE